MHQDICGYCADPFYCCFLLLLIAYAAVGAEKISTVQEAADLISAQIASK